MHDNAVMTKDLVHALSKKVRLNEIFDYYVYYLIKNRIMLHSHFGLNSLNASSFLKQQPQQQRLF